MQNPLDVTNPAGQSSYQKALKGCLADLPPEESSEIRVFFSSTFTDMTEERNFLMKESVPYLRDYCKERCLDFQVIDMRWGLREDTNVEHTTVDVCLEEIDRSQRISAGPYFVAFLGDRYGSRLLPTRVPVTEYRSLRRLASWMDLSDFAIVDKWYVVDTNSVPAVYRLQPITDLLPFYHDTDPKNRIIRKQHEQTWERDNLKMLNAFRLVSTEAVERKIISSEEASKYFISVTHKEVIEGMVNSPDAKMMNINKVLSFHRTLDNINIQHAKAKRFVDLTDDGEIDTEAAQLRRELRDSVVPGSLQLPSIVHQTISWTPNGVNPENPDHAAYLKTLCEIFTGKMMTMIDNCTKGRGNIIPSESQLLYFEVLAHLRFCAAKCQVFCGREKVLQKIRNLLDKVRIVDKELAEKSEEHMDKAAEQQNTQSERQNSDMRMLLDMCKITGATFCYGDTFDDDTSDPARDLKEELVAMPGIDEYKVPLVIYGASGNGKTALMAKLVQQSKKWVPGSVCVVRFFGITPKSSYIRSALVSIITQVQELYKVQPMTGLDLNMDFHYLVMYFNALLWKINSDAKPLFLLLDSVDSLNPMDYAHLMAWVPKMVPPNVHMLISLSADHPSCLANAREELAYEEQFVHLGALDKSSGDRMIRALCHQANRTLTAAQRAVVLETYANTGQALHLKLITHQALSWRSYYNVADLHPADTLEGAITEFFDELEKSLGEAFVSKALGYVTLSMEGLSDGELHDILSLDDEALQDTYIHHLPPDPHVIRIPNSPLVRLKSQLANFLTTQRAGPRSVCSWYHQQFKEAALKRYGAEDVAPQLHAVMAEYYMGTWSHKPKPLELYKGKTASYEDSTRGVPAQPLTYQGFGKTLYNIRKLQELPHHLAHSDAWSDFHAHVACNVEFLVAVSCTLGVTSLLGQFQAMMSRGTDDVEDEEGKQKVKDILLIRSIIRLGIDDIRREPSSVPVQILGQLGPGYRGSPGIEDLLRQCRDHLACSDLAVFVPQNAFMPAPGGLLLSSVSVRLFVSGMERTLGHNVCVDDMKECLYVVEMNAGSKPDNLLVLDYNNGAIISRVNLPFFVHSFYLLAGKRFLLFKVYTKLSKFDPVFNYMLFERNLLSPYSFDKPVVAMSVASHGELIAFAHPEEKMAHLGTPDSKLRKVLVKQHVFMDDHIGVLLFSPTDSHLVCVDTRGNISCYSTAHRQAASLHTSTERLSGMDVHAVEKYRITRSNLLLRCVRKGLDEFGLSVMDLVTRQEKHRLTSEKLKYSFDIVEMDDREEFVIVGCSGTGIVNGNREKPALLWRLSDGELTTTFECQTSWQALKVIGKETLFCLAASAATGIVQILSCGPRNDPFPEPLQLCELTDHSKSIFTLLSIKGDSILLSGAEDNTFKFYDLARILIEKNLVDEDDRLPGRRKRKKKKSKKDEKMTEVEMLGKTTAVAVTGTTDQKAFFGTDKGFVGYTRLDKEDNAGVRLVTVASDLPPVHLFVVSKKGDHLMAAAKNIVAVFDANEAKLLYTVEGLNGEQSISCIAEGGNTAALGHGGMEGKVKLWDLQTGEFIKELNFLYSFQLTAVNRSGTQVVASMFEYPIVMDIYSTEKNPVAGGENLRMDRLDTLMTGLTYICISPDDSLVAACASNGSTRVVSLENKYLHRLQQRSSPSYALFTTDSQLLLTAGYRTIYVWRMGTGQLEFKLSRHQDFVTCLKFALDDRFLVSSSLDHSVAVWDFRTRATVSIIQAQCQVNGFHLSPDLSSLVYVPDRVANVAVVEPNPALRRVLEQGRNVADLSEPETLENASAFATSFNTQKDANRNTSAACVIL